MLLRKKNSNPPISATGRTTWIRIPRSAEDFWGSVETWTEFGAARSSFAMSSWSCEGYVVE
jgi:hypothetical protein